MKAAAATLVSLSWLNFGVAGMQAGFGPFLSVRLTAAGWEPSAIGLVLSAGSLAAVLAQVPSGLIVDQLGTRRGAAAPAILGTALALLLIGHSANFHAVLLAEILQGSCGVGLALAIATLTLSCARQAMLGERLGRNVRSAAAGAALSTGLLGLVGNQLSDRAVFDVAAGFGAIALFALHRIQHADIKSAPARTDHHTAPLPPERRGPPQPIRRLLRDRALLALLGALALFQLGNASVLPLAATQFAEATGGRGTLLAAAAVIVPQLLAMGLSPWVGVRAQLVGRRLPLMVGLAALPVRAAVYAIDVYAIDGSPAITLAAQALDGISAATIGVMIPLIVADITHRGGRFNLALGTTGLVSALGATLSTAAGGALAQAAGLPTAFLALAMAGAGAILVVWAWLPETAPLAQAATAPAAAGISP